MNTSSFLARLSEIQNIIIEHPGLQEYICEKAGEPENYFHGPVRATDIKFIAAKNLVYINLNLFDEILLFAGSKNSEYGFIERLYRRLFLQKIIEQDNWENYIKRKLRHPFYSSTLDIEGQIYGQSLQIFWKDHKEEINNSPLNKLLW